MSAKVDSESQIEISGYPLKMENIKYIAAVDIGEDMCIAAGGDDVVQLVLCSGSGKTLPRIQCHTLLKSLQTGELSAPLITLRQRPSLVYNPWTSLH